MKTNTLPSRRTLVLATAASIATSLMTTPSSAQTTVQAAAKTNQLAKGTFTVKMTPSAESGFADTGANLGRMTLDKVFEGDLVAVGKGEMLTALTMTKGSAGYVAIERVTGTLHGKTGSFVFQHSGAMNRGAQNLSITVVADSGSGDLVGLEGVFKLRIESGKHFYEFEYSLPQLQK
jgi:Protein of unknown function (DUF3224)